MRGVLGIIRKGDLYLFGTEAKQDRPYYGKWRLLGGKLEINENPIEALMREVFEEAKIAIYPTQMLCETVGEYQPIPIDVYVARWLNGEPVPKKDEIGELAWMTLEESLTADMDRVSKIAIDQYILYLERNPQLRHLV